MAFEPTLPAAEKAVQQLLDTIAGEDRSAAGGAKRRIFELQGRAGSGKSWTLHRLQKRLEEQGRAVVRVAPPGHYLDSSILALYEIADQVKLPSDSKRILDDPKIHVSAKVGAISEILSSQKDTVLLLDEPSTWIPQDATEARFQHAGTFVVSALLRENPCQKVVSGNIPQYLTTTFPFVLPEASLPQNWLIQPENWGDLAPAAREIHGLVGENLQKLSPLEIRLLVGIAAISSPQAALGGNIRTPQALAERLWDLLSKRDAMRDALEAWRRLAHVRRPIPEELLTSAFPSKSSTLARHLMQHSLLLRVGDAWIMHDAVQAVAQTDSQLGASDFHAKLVQWYQSRPNEYSASAEATYHAGETGDVQLILGTRPHSVEQLDAIGKRLSRAGHHEKAAAVFRVALELMDADDYAHHYYAYNLDMIGRDPQVVDTHYHKAIALDPRNVWWRSRALTFLLTLSRDERAQDAWEEALYNLRDERTDQSPWLYENLHHWVAQMALYRDNLELAREVLDDVAKPFRVSLGWWNAYDNYLSARIAARSEQALFPLTVPTKLWWEGPHLFDEGELKNLREWFPGRILGTTKESAHVLLGRANGERFDADVPFRTFHDSGIRFPEIRSGRLLEIVVYAGEGGSDQTVIRLHPFRNWREPYLPRPSPDPERYSLRE